MAQLYCISRLTSQLQHERKMFLYMVSRHLTSTCGRLPIHKQVELKNFLSLQQGHHDISRKLGALFPSSNQIISARSFASSTADAVKTAAQDIDVKRKDDSVTLSNIRFDQPQVIFSDLSTRELIKRGLLVWSLQFGIIYQNMSFILSVMYKLFGKRLVHFFVRHTLYQHFTGGETLEDLIKTSMEHASHGIGTMGDYASEAEDGNMISTDWYQTNKHHFLTAIDATASVREANKTWNKAIGQFAFLAAKPTGLYDIVLLRRVNACLNLFHDLYGYGISHVSGNNISLYKPNHHDIFSEKDLPVESARSLLQSLWPSFTEDQITAIIEEMQSLPGASPSNSSAISFIQWSDFFSPELMSQLPAPTLTMNPSVEADLVKNYWLNEHDSKLWEEGKQRMNECFKAAHEKKINLLVDAETTIIQSTIDWICNHAAQVYNAISPEHGDPTKTRAVIYSTHQLYLKNSLGRLKADAQRADRLGYKFATKTVAGAYMTREAAISQEHNIPYPIHDSYQDTRDNYHKGLEFMMSRLPRSEVCCASHNEETIIKASQKLGALTNNDGSKLPLSFAQLKAMGDYLSLQLAKAGVAIYKYTPYGPLDDVLPYLIRRGEENSSLFGSAKKESKMYMSEVRRRLLATIGLA